MKSHSLGLGYGRTILLLLVLGSISLYPVHNIGAVSHKHSVIHVPSDYATIDAAIAAASPNGIILVAAGTYSGFTLDKELKIIGAGSGDTTIAGTVTITASGAELIGFSIVSSGTGVLIDGGSQNKLVNDVISSGAAGIRIQGGGSENKVKDIIITAGGNGVEIEGNDNEIEDNTITATSHAGVAIGEARVGNDIVGNVISGGDRGIYTAGDNGEITGNMITATGTGIEIDRHNNNVVTENTINNAAIGLLIRTGGQFNSIFENNFIDNTLQALDNGVNNSWDKDGRGNFWSDFTGPDNDGDGIVDVPRPIAGSAGSIDHFPLVNPVVIDE